MGVKKSAYVIYEWPPKLNASLEDQSEHILQSTPRIVREVESLQQESALLKSSMSAVQSDIDKVNKETGASMETLVKMDLLKVPFIYSVSTFIAQNLI